MNFAFLKAEAEKVILKSFIAGFSSKPGFFLAAVYWRSIMIRNYIITALRLMRRRPEFAAVNIGGLAVGLAGCILAILFIHDEYAFDRFHDDVDRIYEVRSEIGSGDRKISLETQGPVGAMLAAGFPEVQAATRLARDEVVVRAGEKVFLRKGLGVDPSFFSVFSFPLIEGDAASALRDPFSVVLGRETARLCFGASNPVGRTVSIKIGDETADYRIAGVTGEIPARSSLKFDLLLPILRMKGQLIDQWERNADGSGAGAACFIRLRKGARPELLAARFPHSLDKHLSSLGAAGRHFLFPFAAYHRGRGEYLFSSVLNPRSSPLQSILLASMAFLILLIAGLNSMNLSIGAAASDRIKEIGLRKVLGAGRKDLLRQFRVEGALTSLAALGAGLGIAALVLPAFNRFTGKALRLDFPGIGGPLFVVILVAVLAGAAAGSYPGWILSRLRPTDLFRSRFFSGRKSGFNRVFLFLQFGISIFLLITTVFLYRQHRFLLAADPGFDPARVAVLDLRQLTPQFQNSSRFISSLKSRLLSHPEIKGVSGSACSLTSWSARGLRRAGASQPEFVRFNEVDDSYLAVLGLEMKDGRWFSPAYPSDASDAVVINETFARKYASGQAIGRSLSELLGLKSAARVIGVVRDFHYDALHHAIQPAMMFLGAAQPRWVYVRLEEGNLRRAMDIVAAEFRAVVPGLPFVSSFLDEDTARLYEKEVRWSRMTGIVSLFTVVIACAGVFGLAIQISARKRKEIGIRKVMGASVRQITGLINGQFLKTAAAAGFLAWPAAYLAVKKILADYPYRIPVDFWIFPAGTAAVMILVLITINFHSLKAAGTDPASTLKSE